MSTQLAVVEHVEVLDLAELAVVINREHALAEKAGAEMLQHAIRCGTALLAAKEIVPYGEWVGWLRENTDHSLKRGHLYVRLAHYEPLIAERGWQSITAAEEGLRGCAEVPRRRLDGNAELTQEVKTLRAQGLTYARIGDDLGISSGNARRLDLGLEHCRRELREWRRQRNRERAALDRQERERDEARAVKASPADVQKLHAAVQNMPTLHGKAHAVITDNGLRAEMAEALAVLHDYRDRVTRITLALERL